MRPSLLALLVASALTLSACGSGSTDAPPAPDGGNGSLARFGSVHDEAAGSMRWLAPPETSGSEGHSTVREDEPVPPTRSRILVADTDESGLRDVISIGVIAAPQRTRPSCTQTDSGETIVIAGQPAELSRNGKQSWSCTVARGFAVNLATRTPLENAMRVAAERIVLPASGDVQDVDFGVPPKGYSVSSDHSSPAGRASFAVGGSFARPPEGSSPDPSQFGLTLSLNHGPSANVFGPADGVAERSMHEDIERVQVRGTDGILARFPMGGFQGAPENMTSLSVSWMEYPDLAVTVGLVGLDVDREEVLELAESLVEISREEWMRRYPPDRFSSPDGS